MSEKPEALRLADDLRARIAYRPSRDSTQTLLTCDDAARCLEEQHAENEVLTAKVKAREDEILTHSEAVYEATKLLSEEREKNERLREALEMIAGHRPCVIDGFKRGFMPGAEIAKAALRREET